MAALASIIQDVVLIGGGHSHVAVLKSFGMRPAAGVRLTLICRDTHTPYSGMLPGLVAGHYDFDEAHIDLGRLSRFASARFLRAEAVGIDLAGQRVLCRNRPPVAYDLLSINIGSVPRTVDVPGASQNAVPLKPIGRFIGRWQKLCERVLERQERARIAVVGAGAGGVEMLLALQWRLATLKGGLDRAPEFHLFADGDDILPSQSARVRAAFRRVLTKRKVYVHFGEAAVAVAPNRLATSRGESFDADEIIWATAADAAPWLRGSGLAVDRQGFVLVDRYLRSTSHRQVFAAGDVAAMIDNPRPKAGVFAVRQGPPLARNLRRALRGAPLEAYRPQRQVLSLITTGDKYAVASRGRWSVEGRALWPFKDWIDRRFMRRYNELPPMARETHSIRTARAASGDGAEAMRCGGCGAKIGSAILSRVLRRLRPLQRADVLSGLEMPDDAAVVTAPAQGVMLHSVDFFRAFTDDPYLFGQVTANHCLGDIFAMGGMPQTALAIVTLPPGADDKLEEDLFQLLSGALRVLGESGTALIGGHSGEGAELCLGFAVNGLAERRVLRRGGLRPGDMLLLTKPLGTGTLLAADRLGKAKGRWIDGAYAAMLQSNRQAAGCFHHYGATACTDVTGFGLIGHLLEMLKLSEVDAALDPGSLPALDGALETLRQGIVSSLQPQNLRFRDALHGADTIGIEATHHALLFDPQTAGGLLAGVPAHRAQECLVELHRAGYAQAAIIGRATQPSGSHPCIALTEASGGSEWAARGVVEGGVISAWQQ